MILLGITSPFITFIENKKENVTGVDLTLYSDYEYNMGIWIRDNTPSCSIILSDPETIYIMSGISGRKSVIPIAMLVQDLQLSDQIKLKLIKDNIFNTMKADLAYNFSRIIGENNKVIVIFSGRTAKWLSELSYKFIQYPVDFYETPGFKKFFNNSYFKFVKQFGNNQTYAFELQELDYNYYNHYDVFQMNKIEEYDNISIYAKNPIDAISNWYLEKVIKSGPVSYTVYNQYLCEEGTPPIIKWNVSIPNGYKQISIYIFDLNILNYHPNFFWKFSIDGDSWISGNYFDPLQFLFDFKITDKNRVIWFGHNHNSLNTSKLGTFVFIGYY